MRNITRQEWFGALVAVLVLAVLLSIASPYFLSTRNLSNILVQASVIALLAGGQTFVILTGGVDSGGRRAHRAVRRLCGLHDDQARHRPWHRDSDGGRHWRGGRHF